MFKKKNTGEAISFPLTSLKCSFLFVCFGWVYQGKCSDKVALDSKMLPLVTYCCSGPVEQMLIEFAVSLKSFNRVASRVGKGRNKQNFHLLIHLPKCERLWSLAERTWLKKHSTSARFVQSAFNTFTVLCKVFATLMSSSSVCSHINHILICGKDKQTKYKKQFSNDDFNIMLFSNKAHFDYAGQVTQTHTALWEKGITPQPGCALDNDCWHQLFMKTIWKQFFT